MRIKVGEIYNATENHFQNGNAVVIHRGGTGSGKTYDIMSYLFVQALTHESKVFTVVSESVPHLDIGVIRILNEIIAKSGIQLRFNATKRLFEFPTKSIIEFFSADRIDKALGSRRYLLYANEVNSLKYEIVDELARRSQFNIFDFNPVAEFWLEDKFLPYYPKTQIVKSNYTWNKFLPKHEVERIELRAKLDENFNRVHVLAEYGSSEHLVFQNVILIDEFPKDIKFIYGLDFGYIAPSSLVKVGLIDTDLFIDEIFYQSGLDTINLITKVKQGVGNSIVIADSEDKRMINELYNAGLNVHAAKKGSGSVTAGVSFLQSCKIHITKKSTNAIKEFRNYINAQDKLGNYTGIYFGDDHAIDATRYAVEGIRTKAGSGVVASINRQKHGLVYGR